MICFDLTETYSISQCWAVVTNESNAEILSKLQVSEWIHKMPIQCQSHHALGCGNCVTSITPTWSHINTCHILKALDTI